MAAGLAAIASTSTAFAGDVLELRAGRIALSGAATRGFQALESKQSHVFVAQWQNPLTSQQQQALESRGFHVLRYLPQDALVLRSPVGVAVSAEQIGARAVLPFLGQWKLSPEFARDLAAKSASKKWAMVTLFDGADISKLLGEIRRIPGASVLRAEENELAVSANAEGLMQVASFDDVEWIQDLPLWTTMDYSIALSDQNPPPYVPPALTGYESGAKIMGFDAAYALGLTGRAQTVAMADTGVDTGDVTKLHGDLKSVVKKGYALGIGGKLWDDPQGHGTHVCGSVVGTGAMSQGAIRGGAYEATMLASSIWSPIMDNLAFPSDFNKLFNPPYNDGARVHTNSWGSARDLGSYDGFATSVDKYLWEHPDFLVLFAAGNSGEDANADGLIDEGSIGSPATAKNVLSVGASENLLAEGGIQRPVGSLRDGDKKWGVEPIKSDMLSNNPNGLAAFSSRGPTQDGRLKPEIVAPGTNIVSTRSHHPKATQLWGAYNDEYVYAGGTSMATPLTAGAAVVARQYLMEKAGQTAPSAALLKATMIHSAFDMFPGQFGFGKGQELAKPRPNVHEGYGRVDLTALTQLAGQTVFIDSKQGLATNGSEEISLALDAGKGLRATLVYTDAPASPSAGKALVNDLDLEVVKPSGEVVSLKDRVNNSEMVEWKPAQAEAGTYRIRVVGKNVPQGKNGKQPYALVVSATN